MFSGFDPRNRGIRKYGWNLDIDTGSVPEDVWALGGTKSFLTGATALFVSSSDAGDTTQTVIIQGLDQDGNQQQAEVSLNGQVQVAVPGLWLDAERAYNPGTVAAYTGNLYIATAGALTGGVPDDLTTVLAYVPAATQQTMQCQHLVPKKDLFGRPIRRGWCTQANINLDSNVAAATKAKFELLVKSFDSTVWRTQDAVGLNSDVYMKHNFDLCKSIELQPLEKIKLVCTTTDKNNTPAIGNMVIFWE
jgi:hypothetical protein